MFMVIMMIKNFALYVFSICFSVAVFASNSDNTIKVGTGSTTGVYYPTGGAICRIVNKQSTTGPDAPLCIAESTTGSTNNAINLNRKTIDFAILQEDILSDAYYGDGKRFLNHEKPNLRVLFRLYPEVFTVLAKKTDNIRSFIDLKGKDIGVGLSGSGDFNNLRRYLHFQGYKPKDFANLFYSSRGGNDRLCSDGLDAAIVTIGHPNIFIRRTLEGCEGQLVGLSEVAIQKLTATYPTYMKSTIYKGTYDNAENILTFGVYSVFATHADIPEETVYQMTKSIFENLDMLRNAHPVLKRMAFDNMIIEKPNIPIHPGALRYFKEVKLLKSTK